MSLDDQPDNIRDFCIDVTQPNTGREYALTLLENLNYVFVHFPSELITADQKEAWIKQGSVLCLAAGTGKGESAFLETLGIAGENVTLMDKKKPAFVADVGETQPRYIEQSIFDWSRDVVQAELDHERSEKSEVPKHRILTLFGADYILEKKTPSEVAVLANALFHSVEPGGILFIAPVFDKDVEKALITAGFARLDWQAVQVFQRPTNN